MEKLREIMDSRKNEPGLWETIWSVHSLFTYHWRWEEMEEAGNEEAKTLLDQPAVWGDDYIALLDEQGALKLPPLLRKVSPRKKAVLTIAILEGEGCFRLLPDKYSEGEVTDENKMP